MRKRMKCLAFSVLLIVCLFASSAWAATYCVNNQAPNASDANPGTLDAPWLTIQHAADMVTAGDTVIVKPGVYYESVKLSKTGTAPASIVFKGEPGTVVDGAGLNIYYLPDMAGFNNIVWNANLGYYVSSLVDYIQIEGFEIRNFSYGVYASGASYDSVNNILLGGNGWIVKNNIIHDVGGTGISLWSGSTPEGANRIIGNYLYNNSAFDIHTHHYSIVERNVALSHSTGENIRSCFGPGSHKVNNNTVMNGNRGILVGLPYSEYKNNIIMNIQPRIDSWNGQTYQSGGFAFVYWVYTDISTVNISYNNIYNSYALFGDWSNNQYSFPTTAIGNISADPLFVNNTADYTGDYHLTANSPCIDAGDPADPVPAGGGSRIDIGAYEYTQQQLDIPALIAEKHKFYDAGLIDNKGIMTSLDAKLNAAQAALMRGEPRTAKNILNAMINEARAQAGKHVDAGAAQALIEDAEMILQQIDFIETRSSKK